MSIRSRASVQAKYRGIAHDHSDKLDVCVAFKSVLRQPYVAVAGGNHQGRGFVVSLDYRGAPPGTGCHPTRHCSGPTEASTKKNLVVYECRSRLGAGCNVPLVAERPNIERCEGSLPSNLTTVMERLAADTWSRIPLVRDLGIAFGEETFTDLLLLDLILSAKQRTQIIQTKKSAEAVQGTDWEWWIGSDSLGWIPYAIQAKRIAKKGTNYTSLTHRVNGTPQIDLLERYAASQQSYPIYCFYNSVPSIDVTKFWHCGLPPKEPQLGCTVVPTDVVRKAINQYGGKNFEFIHEHDDALPWRCLTTCPWIAAAYLKKPISATRTRTGQGFFAPDRLRPRPLPAALAQARKTGEIIDRSVRHDESDLVLSPGRVVILEAGEELNEGWERFGQGYRSQ